VNAYALTYAVLLLPAAALGERLGRRRVFVTGLALFTLASAIAGLAPNAVILVVARAVQGVAGAAIPGQHRTVRARLRGDPRRHRRVDLAVATGRTGQRYGAAGRVRRLAAAHRPPDAAHPVPAERARLRPAGRRTAAATGQRYPADHRPAGRSPRRPARRPPTD